MKTHKYTILIIAITLLLGGCTTNKTENNNNTQSTVYEETDQNNLGENLPVSRALAAKMIALTFLEAEEINTMEREINFTDVSEGDWYFPYINAVWVKGYMKGDGEGFKPLEPLSLSNAQVLIDKIYTGNKTRIKVTQETKDKPISLALWSQLFKKAVEGEENSFDKYGIKENEYIVFATPNNSPISPWTMATDKGNIKFSGFNMDGFIDKKIKVLEKDGEVLSVISVTSNAPIAENGYIAEVGEGKLLVNIGGQERWLGYTGEAAVGIGDITLNNGKITNIVAADEVIRGKVLKATETEINLKEHGVLKNDENIKIYGDKNNKTNLLGIKNLICGSDICDYYLKDGVVAGGVITAEAEADTLRVVLSTTDFAGYIHKEGEFYAQNGLIIDDGETQKEFTESVVLKNEMFKNNRIFISPKNAGDKITLKSVIKNGEINPEYRGNIEVEKVEEGYVIINEVGLEEYLYSVVPSEMPTSYGVEAAKVQAVTARSYAFNQFFANKFHDYGGNIDDSVMCQVYNNIGESQIAIDAVDGTKGVCLTYDNTVISANFFSTSSGHTANSGEVWADTGLKQFPSNSPEYLTAKKQYSSGDYGDLSKEENAAKFFKATDIKCYDSDVSWFRWNVEMTMEEITASVNKNIKDAYDRNKMLVKTLDSDGKYRSKPIESVGTVTDIAVTKRGEGGNIMELTIKGTEKQVLIKTEYAVRTILRPVQYIESKDKIVVSCQNGSKFSDYSLMPSGFFVFDKITDESGKVTGMKFYGGGNGHGVGMSQNGVYGMVKAGYKYDEILKHYYENTSINKVIG